MENDNDDVYDFSEYKIYITNKNYNLEIEDLNVNNKLYDCFICYLIIDTE